jgi:hypothetical protein
MEVQHGNSQQVLVSGNINYQLFYYAFRLWGSRKSYLWKRISEVHKLMVDIQTIHAKLNSRVGNSRKHRSRSQMIIK